MEADRGFRLWQERLRAALRQWEMSDHDEGALLRGVLLAEATGWKTSRGEDLSPGEAAFIDTSFSTMEEARRRELAQARALAEQQAKYAKLRGRQAIALGVAFLVAVAFAGFAWIQRNRAEKLRIAGSVSTIPMSAECGYDPNVPTDASSHGPLQLVVAGVWKKGTTEAENFVKVLQAFREATGASVVYAYDPRPRDMASDLTKRIDGGCPPDVVLLPNPGLLKDLARHKKLRPIGSVVGDLVAKNYSTGAASIGTVDGDLYGVWFKAANKSMIWYRPDIFQRAAVGTPKSWEDLKAVASQIHGRGRAPFAVAGADGWTLTDWFENVYLATAGGEMYDNLANHKVAWNDPSVKRALNTLAEIFGKQEWLEGGTKGALKTNYESSVGSVFSALPTAAMVYEGDFVAEAGRDVRKRATGQAMPQFFDFPAIGGSRPLIVGGDLAGLITDNEAARRLIRFLATPEAAGVWAQEGGFVSPNTKLNLAVYRDDGRRETARTLTQSLAFRFDLSDLQPPEFGANPNQGMWQVFQDFLRNPQDVDGITEKLEQQAKTAWGR
jgi:alpha-glucoside transport system substrate-binding protein